MKSLKLLLLTICIISTPSLFSQNNNSEGEALTVILSKIKNEAIPDSLKMILLDAAIDIANSKNNKTDEMVLLLEKVELHYAMCNNRDALSNCQLAGEIIDKAITANQDNKYLTELKLRAIWNIARIENRFAFYDRTMQHLYDVLKLSDGKYPLYEARAKMGLGVVFYELGNFSQAEMYFTASSLIYKNLNDAKGLWQSYNNMTAIFHANNQHDSSLIYLNKALQLCESPKMFEERVITLRNIGNVYHSSNDYDKAIESFSQAKLIAMSHNVTGMMSIINSDLAELYSKKGNQALAIKLLEQAIEYSDKYRMRADKALALNKLSAVYSKLGDWRKSNEYLHEYVKLSDTLSKTDIDNKIVAMQTDFNAFKTEKQNEILVKNLQLKESDILKKNLVIAILILTIGIVILIFIIIIRKMIVKYKVRQLYSSNQHGNDEHSSEIKSRLELEIDQKNRELTANALLLTRSDNIANRLNTKIDLLSEIIPSDINSHLVIREMKQITKELSIGNAWEEFRLYFEQVHQSFYTKLDLISPGLTSGEKRLCALISLNLSTKEIAQLTNRNYKSVDVARFRLRKKLNISHEESLTDFLKNITNS